MEDKTVTKTVSRYRQCKFLIFNIYKLHLLNSGSTHNYCYTTTRFDWVWDWLDILPQCSIHMDVKTGWCVQCNGYVNWSWQGEVSCLMFHLHIWTCCVISRKWLVQQSVWVDQGAPAMFVHMYNRHVYRDMYEVMRLSHCSAHVLSRINKLISMSVYNGNISQCIIATSAA